MTCSVCNPGSICVLQDRRRSEKTQGKHCLSDKLIDADIEEYRAIKNAEHEILPKRWAYFEGDRYRKTCLRFFKLMCATVLGKICVSDQP